jgi:hypothetical protein
MSPLDKAEQVIAAAVRDAYMAQPGAMEIAAVSVFPLQVLAANGSSGQMYRIPVIPGPDATAGFGTPVLGVSAARRGGGVCARDTERIAAAVSRGAIPTYRAAFWAACAAAGQSIDVVDQLEGGVFSAAAAPSQPDDYERMFGASQARQADGDTPEYGELFGSAEEGQRRADEVQAAARARVTAMTEDEVHRELFGPTRKAPAVPVAASTAAAPANGRPAKRYRVHHPFVSLRVPDVTASAGGGVPRWRLIDLRVGDRVPADAHPDDITRLLNTKSSHGTHIKSC